MSLIRKRGFVVSSVVDDVLIIDTRSLGPRPVFKSSKLQAISVAKARASRTGKRWGVYRCTPVRDRGGGCAIVGYTSDDERGRVVFRRY